MWIGRDDDVPAAVRDALERWRAVLATRAGFVANPQRRWFETHRTRDKAQLCQPKVIALYRTDHGRFAVDEHGDWQPSNKTTLCTPRADGLSVSYLAGLLNSELLDLWYAVRGKTPRDVWRNYEPKPMARIPYRHVDLAEPPSARVRAVVDATDPSARLSALDNLLAGPATDAEHHDGPLGTATIEDSELRFTRARRVTARVTGLPERLTLLELLIAGRTRIGASELDATLLPKDIVAFDALADRRRDECEALLVEGRELVAHAVARAQRATVDPADSD